MTDSNKTQVAVILDESGSMGVRVKDVIGGFDTFIAEQKKLPGTATLTLTRFSDTSKIDYSDRPLADVPSLSATYRPAGGTALYDAVCKTIDEMGQRLERLPEHERPGKVVVVIITDGEENSSKEYTAKMVSDKIAHQRDKYQWVFTFLGADQDAITAAGKIGIQACMAANFAGTRSVRAFASLSSNISNYRKAGGQSISMSYSEAQRQDMTSGPT